MRRALIVPALLASAMLLAGCGATQKLVDVIGNEHAEVSIDYRRGVDIEEMPEPTPNDYKITIVIRGQLGPGDGDPMAGLMAAGLF